MNKRELIKALFKNPTIKALYESGHFDASDINRAILSEAEEKTDTEGSGDGTTDGKEYSAEEKKEYMSLAKLVLKANALINKPEFVKKQVKFLKSLDDTNFLKELVFAYLDASDETNQTTTASQLIDRYAKDENIKPLQQQIEKLKASLGKIQGELTKPSEEPSNASVNEYVDELVNKFDEKVSKVLQNKIADIFDNQGLSIAKAFIMYAIGSKEKIQESEDGGQTDLFMSSKVEPFLTDAGLSEDDRAKEFLNKIVSATEVQDLYGEIDKEINLPQDDVPTDDSTEGDLKQKRQQLANRASAALRVLNVKDSELLKNDTFMIFMGSVLEKEGVIREQKEQLESYVEKYLPQLENEETRKEFYITQEEVGELKTFLETNKADVDKIIAAAVKASKDSKDPNLEDESPPELAELQENWTDVLMTFFGKNPNKSSFMRRLLLRSQAEMLYGVMDVLEQISDPEQMSAYTDMNQDDEREAQADKAKEPELQREGSLGDAMDKAKEKEAPQEPEEEQPQSEPEVQSDKVELPVKTRRIIKQDLQSMVDLLRQLKLAIKDYSMYATRKSADPRFDGSKLKANMDELLLQVQDDIYDLHSNLKPADLAPETDDGSLEEALNGIMLEEDDPERQAKIQLVRQTYDNAKREYIYSLATSMEQGNWGKSQASAKKILDILKEEKFISLFPTGMKTAGGKVMTVGKAYESMTAVIQEFVETVRDIVLISKEKYIAKTSLTQAKNKLKKISIEIAELFRVPSKFSPEEIKQAKEEEAATPANKAITPESDDKLEQKEGDNTAGPAAPEDDETTEPPTGEEDIGQEIDQSENIDDAEKEQTKQEAEQAKQWFNGLDDSRKSSIAEFVKQMISRGAQKLDEQDVRPYTNDITPEMRQVINNFSKQTKEFHKGFNKLIPLAIEDMDEDHVEKVISIMRDDSENFAKHLKTIFKLKDKLGLDTVMKFVNSMAGKIGELSKELKQKITKKYNEIKPIIKKTASNEMELIKGALKFFATEASDKVAKNKGLTPREKQLIDNFDMQKSLWVQSLKSYLDKSKEGLSDIQKSKYVQMAIIYYQTLKSAKRKILDQASEKLVINLNKALVSLSSMFSKISSNLRGLAFGFISSLIDSGISGDKSDPSKPSPLPPGTPDDDIHNKIGPDRLEESLKPIIATMLKEHYNY